MIPSVMRRVYAITYWRLWEAFNVVKRLSDFCEPVRYQTNFYSEQRLSNHVKTAVYRKQQIRDYYKFHPNAACLRHHNRKSNIDAAMNYVTKLTIAPLACLGVRILYKLDELADSVASVICGFKLLAQRT
jgi:hypothetical protein